MFNSLTWKTTPKEPFPTTLSALYVKLCCNENKTSEIFDFEEFSQIKESSFGKNRLKSQLSSLLIKPRVFVVVVISCILGCDETYWFGFLLTFLSLLIKRQG